MIVSPVNSQSDIDEGGPPLVPGLTSLSPNKWMSVLGLSNQDDSDDDPTTLLIEAGQLFARAAELDPAILLDILEMGKAIAKTTLTLQAQNQQPAVQNQMPMPAMPPQQPMPQPGMMTAQPVPPQMPGGPPMQPPQSPY